MAMKRVEDARRSYEKGDLKGSAQAHSKDRITAARQARQAEEKHGGASSQYLGEIVYGGLDGIITTFAVVSGVAGAQLGSEIILIMGLANLFADGFSMATGAYLSAKSEKEYYQREYQREAWEVEHFPDGEKAELYELYLEKGYSPEDAQKLVDIHTKDKTLWVKAMMVDELGMLADDGNPLYNGLATLISFLVAGAVPLLIYVLGIFFPIAPQLSFPVSFILSGFALFGLGAAKVLVTRLNPVRSGIEMLAVGGLAAGVAYGVGYLLRLLGIGG